MKNPSKWPPTETSLSVTDKTGLIMTYFVRSSSSFYPEEESIHLKMTRVIAKLIIVTWQCYQAAWLFFPPQWHDILMYRKRMLLTSAAIKYMFNPSSLESELAWPTVVFSHWQACLLGMSSSAPVMGKRAEGSQKGRQWVSQSYT